MGDTQITTSCLININTTLSCNVCSTSTSANTHSAEPTDRVHKGHTSTHHTANHNHCMTCRLHLYTMSAHCHMSLNRLILLKLFTDWRSDFRTRIHQMLSGRCTKFRNRVGPTRRRAYGAITLHLHSSFPFSTRPVRRMLPVIITPEPLRSRWERF